MSVRIYSGLFFESYILMPSSIVTVLVGKTQKRYGEMMCSEKRMLLKAQEQVLASRQSENMACPWAHSLA